MQTQYQNLLQKLANICQQVSCCFSNHDESMEVRDYVNTSLHSQFPWPRLAVEATEHQYPDGVSVGGRQQCWQVRWSWCSVCEASRQSDSMGNSGDLTIFWSSLPTDPRCMYGWTRLSPVGFSWQMTPSNGTICLCLKCDINFISRQKSSTISSVSDWL